MRINAIIVGVLLLSAPPAQADEPLPAPLAEVGVDERLGNQVPLDAEFVDQRGRRVRLADLVQKGKPTVLTLVYYECPMLCNLVLSGLVSAMKSAGLRPGDDYALITLSFNPDESPADAAERQRGYVQALAPAVPADFNAWPFLTGQKSEIDKVAGALGFRYQYDASNKQYAHVAVIFVLSPEGKITRYLYGVQYRPRDLKMAVLEAAEGKVGSTIDRVLFHCYRYSPASRRYGLYLARFFQVGGALILLIVGGLLLASWRRDGRTRHGGAQS